MPGDRPSALLLAPESPYPLAGGGALRTASLLNHLASAYETDLVVFRQPGEPPPESALPAGLVRRASVLVLPANRRDPASRALRNAARLVRGVPPLIDRFAGFETQLQEILSGRRYHIAVVEHFWCAPYAEQVGAVCDRLVLDLHNIESCLHMSCADAENGAAAFAHRQFHSACLEMERRWLPRFSTVLVSSAEDAARARAIAPRASVSVYPNALPAAPIPTRRGADEAIVFSGNLDYHPNRSAVRFFRGEVWPLLRERWPALVWRLVGKNPQAVGRWVSGDPRIQVTGPVGNAVAELARARIAVVPLLSGSGTRFKILEAWAAGLPVVSTAIGAEGLGAHDGEHLLIADSPAAFAEAVSRLLACTELARNLGAAGRLLLEKEFTWETAWKSLDF